MFPEMGQIYRKCIARYSVRFGYLFLFMEKILKRHKSVVRVHEISGHFMRISSTFCFCLFRQLYSTFSDQILRSLL